MTHPIPNSNAAFCFCMLNVVILGGILAVDKQVAVDQIVNGEEETVDKIEDREHLMRQSTFSGR